MNTNEMPFWNNNYTLYDLLVLIHIHISFFCFRVTNWITLYFIIVKSELRMGKPTCEYIQKLDTVKTALRVVGEIFFIYIIYMNIYIYILQPFSSVSSFTVYSYIILPIHNLLFTITPLPKSLSTKQK